MRQTSSRREAWFGLARPRGLAAGALVVLVRSAALGARVLLAVSFYWTDWMSPHSQPRALRHTTVLSNIMSL